MRNTRPWYTTWLIVPVVVILPPLGLPILWRSSRTLGSKIIISALFVLLAAGAVSGFYFQGKLIYAEDPISGYDVRLDEKGNYRTPRILPLERDVFNEVTYELRRNPPSRDTLTEDVMSIQDFEPEKEASWYISFFNLLLSNW